MREVIEDCFCCLDDCCKQLIDNVTPCCECEYLYIQEHFEDI